MQRSLPRFWRRTQVATNAMLAALALFAGAALVLPVAPAAPEPSVARLAETGVARDGRPAARLFADHVAGGIVPFVFARRR